MEAGGVEPPFTAKLYEPLSKCGCPLPIGSLSRPLDFVFFFECLKSFLHLPLFACFLLLDCLLFFLLQHGLICFVTSGIILESLSGSIIQHIDITCRLHENLPRMTDMDIWFDAFKRIDSVTA